MSTSGERVALLLRVHGDSYRSAAERCGLDHTTIMRVERGETENPATLAKIAECYGVPVGWLRGGPDLATDFTFAVLLRPLRDRAHFLWEPERRLGFALHFLLRPTHARYTLSQLAEMLQVDEVNLASILAQEHGQLPAAKIERLCTATGLPLSWFQTGMVGREDEGETLVGLAEWALSCLAEAIGLPMSEDEIHEVALTLV